MLKKTETKLTSMYAGHPQQGSDGALHALEPTTRISAKQGQFLASFHQQMQPALSIEIGFAYGFSTLFLLDTMFERAYGQHIAIDPYETTMWHGIGLTSVAELGYGSRFGHIPKPAVEALTIFKNTDVRSEFVYIDGDHRFDRALMDFICTDEVLTVGGIVILDDMWMPSIQKLAAFIRNNLSSYAEVYSEIDNVFCAQKINEDQRVWHHYVDF